MKIVDDNLRVDSSSINRFRFKCDRSDSPSHCVHAAWGSYLETRSSDLSFLHNSPPNCTGLDLEEKKKVNHDMCVL